MILNSANQQVIQRNWTPLHYIEDGVVKKHTNQSANEQFVYEILPSQYTRGQYYGTLDYLEGLYHPTGKAAGKLDHHHSVFSHDKMWMNHIFNEGRVGGVKESRVQLDWLPLEIDGESITHSMETARQIIQGPLRTCTDHVRVFWSGNRSIHLMVDGQLFGNLRGSQEWLAGDGKVAYQLAHLLVRHIATVHMPYMRTEQQLPHAQRKMHEVIDPNLYRVNSTIRMPGTIHPKTNKPKVEIGVHNLFMNHIEYFSYKRSNVAPKLLYLVTKSLIPVRKPKYVRDSNQQAYSSDDYEKIYRQFMDIDGYISGGWINKLESPFYPDNNPSVAINVKTGVYIDFGEPSHKFNIEEFIMKLKDCDVNEAKNIIYKILNE